MSVIPEQRCGAVALERAVHVDTEPCPVYEPPVDCAVSSFFEEQFEGEKKREFIILM